MCDAKRVLLFPHWARGAVQPPPPGATVVKPVSAPDVEHLGAVPLILLRPWRGEQAAAGGTRRLRRRSPPVTFLCTGFLNASGKCEAAALLAAALAGCGTADSLQRLRLTVQELTFPCSGWVSELRSLRVLHIDCADMEDGLLIIEQSFESLSQLEDLALTSDYTSLRITPAARLPLSLTCLHIEGDDAAGLPPQVGRVLGSWLGARLPLALSRAAGSRASSASKLPTAPPISCALACHPPTHPPPSSVQLSRLSRLQALSFATAPHYQGEGFAPLAALPALRKLSLVNLAHLPPCLSALTSLEALAIVSADCDPTPALPYESGGLVAAALLHLPRLAFCCLRDIPGMPELPPGITGLTRLEASFH